jgi:ribonuclease Z
MQILFLGSAGSFVTASRSNPSILIDEDLLIDVGEGVTQKLLQFGSLKTIRKILISHLHVDHFIGIFSFLWHQWLVERDTSPIVIWGPPDIQNIHQILQISYTPVDAFPFTINYEPLDPQDNILEFGEISVTRVLHPVYTLGFRINRDRSVCYSSDTAPLDRMIQLAQNCDVLIHEASFPTKFAKQAHKYFHSTPQDAAKIANEARVKKLVLFHILGEFEEDFQVMQKEAQDFFDGEVLIAEDMKILEI